MTGGAAGSVASGSGGGKVGGKVGVPEIAALLKVNGRLPRRAVLLPDGSLGDRVSHPGVPEVDLLSRLCEVCRQAAGQASHPRHTSALLEAALATNAPGPWDAVRDDLATGDFDVDAAVATVQQGQGCAALVTCLAGARNQMHMLGLACVMAVLLPKLTREARLELGTALGFQLRAVFDAILRHGATLSRDVLDAVLDGFGKVLATAGVADSRVADVVVHALHAKRYELLRMFVHVPTAYLRHKPQILATLLDAARTVAPTSRYPVVALLARIAADDPEVLRGQQEAVGDVAAACLSGAVNDARTCLAVASLVRVCSGCGNPVAAKLAMALEACASSLLNARRTPPPG